MVPGDDVRTIRYFDGDDEIVELRSLYSASAGASWDLPVIVRDGSSSRWCDSDGMHVTSLYAITSSGLDISLYAAWATDSVGLDVYVEETQDGLRIAASVDPQDSTVYLRAISRSAIGFEERVFALGGSEGWTATISVPSSASSVLLYATYGAEDSFGDSIESIMIDLEVRS